MARVTKKGIVQDDWLYGTPFTCRWCHAEFVLERGVDHPLLFNSQDFNQKYNVSYANVTCPGCQSYTQIMNPLHKQPIVMYDDAWLDDAEVLARCTQALLNARFKGDEDASREDYINAYAEAHARTDALIVLKEAFAAKAEHESWDDDRDWSDE